MIRLILALCILTSPALACGGPCNPPDPEPPEQPTSDGDGPVRPAYSPCCIRDGVVVARFVLFQSRAVTLARCERDVAEGAQVFACDGEIGEAVK